jgi:hypothetical protein
MRRTSSPVAAGDRYARKANAALDQRVWLAKSLATAGYPPEDLRLMAEENH